MRIGIATAGLDFDGDSLKTKALGGSETAVISVSKALASRGHNVNVFCECSKPGNYGGVTYTHRSQFVAQTGVIPFDVLIACRWAEYLGAPSLAGLRVLWLHDVPSNKEHLMPALWQTDFLMGLSDYHIDLYCKEIPELREHFWKTSNGVDFDLIKANIKPKDPKKLIYTSRPERGLLVLLQDIFPRLLQKDPELRLYYSTYQLDGTAKLPPVVQQIHERCAEESKRYPANVINMGSLPKAELYQQISSAAALVYPTGFPEIFCITAAEAAACGTPIVTTADFSLPEVVGSGGVLIDGNPESEEYQTNFVEGVMHLLSNAEFYRKKVDNGNGRIHDLGYTWDKVAESWEKKFNDTLNERASANAAAITKELVRTNDLKLAKISAEQRGLSDLVSEIDSKISSVINKPYEHGDITGRYAKSVDRFQKQAELLMAMKPQIRTFLDYECDDLSFGLAVKRLSPATEVVLYPRSDEIADRMRVFAVSAGVDVAVTRKLTDAKYDVVHIDCRLEHSLSPSDYLKRVMDYCGEGGVLSFATLFGDDLLKYGQTPRQLWNFDYIDLEDLFKREGNLYHLSFHDARIRPVYERIHGFWIGGVRKTSQFGKIDVKAKFRRTRPYQVLKANIIARDSETWLPFCMESICDVCDEVLVVDTGSKDRTVEVAKLYGARVEFVEFDNFSQARNYGLDRIGDADWILGIDTDERLAYPNQLRRYLYGQIFNGLILRQKHLSLDQEKVTFDLPIRVYRNRTNYRYTGYIHEHVENVAERMFDAEIKPGLVLPDVELAHYGYENENQRRRKCSRRNIELLIRDIEDNASRGRMLTWVLVIRDYLNIVKWGLEKTGKISPGSIEHEYLAAGVTTFRTFFSDGESKYCELARKIYEDILLLMASFNLSYPGKDHPPFQVAFTLAGSVGGFESGKTHAPNYYWFLDDQEFIEFAKARSANLVTRMGIAPKDKYADFQVFHRPDGIPELPDARRLLSRGLHAT